MAYNTTAAFGELFKNSFDFNQLFSTQRRNIEALSAANQIVTESLQAIMRRQAEVVRANVENTLKVSKDILTSGAPENNLSRQADLVRAFHQNTLSNLREVSELAAKSSFEAFDVLNRRAAESLDEISSSTSSTKRKAA